VGLSYTKLVAKEVLLSSSPIQSGIVSRYQVMMFKYCLSTKYKLLNNIMILQLTLLHLIPNLNLYVREMILKTKVKGVHL
jgi:hypothetical protein